MARRQRKPHSPERLAEIQRQTGQVLDLLPVVGDARSAGRAYDAWNQGDYTGAALEAAGTAAGWIPIAGPLAKGAKAGRSALANKAVPRVITDQATGRRRGPLATGFDKALMPYVTRGPGTRDYGKAMPRFTKKEEVAAREFDKAFPGEGRNIVADIKREAADPSQAIERNLGPSQVIREATSGTTRPRRSKMGHMIPPGEGAWAQMWRPYDTPDGKTVSATLDDKGNVVNALDIPGRPSSTRAGNEFSTVTRDMAQAGHPLGYTKISDRIKHPGPLQQAAAPSIPPAMARFVENGKPKPGTPAPILEILAKAGIK